MLGGDKSVLESKISKITNTEIIDEAFSHTLKKHLKQEKKNNKLLPKDIFEGKCGCDKKDKKKKKKYK